MNHPDEPRPEGEVVGIHNRLAEIGRHEGIETGPRIIGRILQRIACLDSHTVHDGTIGRADEIVLGREIITDKTGCHVGPQRDFTHCCTSEAALRHTFERRRDQILAAFVLAFAAEALACARAVRCH